MQKGLYECLEHVEWSMTLHTYFLTNDFISLYLIITSYLHLVPLSTVFFEERALDLIHSTNLVKFAIQRLVTSQF